MIKRLDKLPKRKVTVNELLDAEKTQDVLDEINSVEDIDELAVMWTT